MKLFMEEFPIMNTGEFLVLCVMLVTKVGKMTNLTVEVGNVCLSGIYLGKKDGSCLIWKRKFFLSLVMSISLKVCFPFMKPKKQTHELTKLGPQCWSMFLKRTLQLGQFPLPPQLNPIFRIKMRL
ncbi:hypothetical protein AHAS_Ahas02G0178600 [Arachis hypogaea]